MASKGFIYCLSNKSFKTDIYKIGSTKNNPILRKNQLFNTSVPCPFKLEFAKEVYDYKQKEKSLHKILIANNKRFDNRREFFNLPLLEIKEYFNLIDGNWFEDSENIISSSEFKLFTYYHIKIRQYIYHE